MGKSKIVDCNRIMGFKKEVERMCESYKSCIECPLKDIGLSLHKKCTDMSDITQEHIDKVQAWSDSSQEELKIGDTVRVTDSRYVCSTFYEFMSAFGTENEKLFWEYGKLPEDKIYTIDSINKHPDDDRSLAIITRRFSEKSYRKYIGVFVVDIRGLVETL